MNEKYTTSVSYGASAATIIAGLTLSDWAVAVGMACALGTLIVNWYFKRLEHLRQEAEHQARMRQEQIEMEIRSLKLQRMKNHQHGHGAAIGANHEH